MPRITPLESKHYSSEIRIAFVQHKTVYNTSITNLKATLGHSPTAFKVYMQWYPLFEELKGLLDSRRATLFAWVITEATNNPLFIAYFRKEITDSGESPDELDLSEEDFQLISFGTAIAQNNGVVQDEIYDLIRDRYSDEKIVLLTAFAGIMIATSILSNVLKTETDDYLVPFLTESQTA